MKRVYSQIKDYESEIVTRRKIDAIRFEELKMTKFINNVSHNQNYKFPVMSTPTNNLNTPFSNKIVSNTEVKKLPSNFSYNNNILSGLKEENKNLNKVNSTLNFNKNKNKNLLNIPLITNENKRDFSYTNLKTETRSNFKNTFEEVIKNKKTLINIPENKNKSFNNSFTTNNSNNWNKISQHSELINSTPNSKIKFLQTESDGKYQTPKFNEIIKDHKKENKLFLNNPFIPLNLKVNINKTIIKNKIF